MHYAQLEFTRAQGRITASGLAALAVFYAGGENQPVLVADVTSTGQW